MDKKLEILERKDLRKQPYAVPEGYFAALQERLGAIPEMERQDAIPGKERSRQERPGALPRLESTPRTRIRPVLAFATGIAAALAAVLLLVSRPAPAPESEPVSYEQYAYADLIPHTDPYIYFDIEP